jgi:hypothetical protein
MQGQQYQKKRSQSKQHRTSIPWDIVLPGLLSGILLALLEFSFTYAVVFFQFLPILANASIILFIWFWDLMIPALLAFFWTNETQDPHIGYYSGTRAGLYSAITKLILAVLFAIHISLFLLIPYIFFIPLFVIWMGGMLSMLGASLGSWRPRK